MQQEPGDSGVAPTAYAYYIIDEVLNYGGFFGRNTVTIYAHTPATPDDDRKFIIAEHNFENLRDGDRFKVTEGQMLGLVLDGDEVRSARVVGAPTREGLRAATAPPRPLPGHELEVRARAYHCGHCKLWIAGEPPRQGADGPYLCEICGNPLQSTNPTKPDSERRP